MICTYCGKEIQNGITFCPYCGSTVNNAKENTKMKKHNPAKVLVSIAAVAVVAAGGWAFANRTPTIDVSKYMTLSADGYNTVGKLNISFDTEKLEKDYGKQIATRFKKQMKNLKDDTYGLSSLTASLYDGYEADLFAETCATGSADKTKGLSNGDVVTYTWDDNSDEAEEAFGVKVKYTDITYTVSGLASVNTFDAFDGVDVEFSGISPDGRATVNSLPTAAEAQGLYYTLDENSGLSNGDTVTLTVHSNRDDFSDCIDKYGAMPQATEKTFTVEGLNEYVTSADTLSDSVLVSLQNQAEDVFKSYAAQRFSNGQTFKGMTYLGNYILTPKNKDSWGDKDRIVLAYQVTVHHDYTSELNTTYDADDSFFWYITFNNVSKDADGNIASGLNDYDTPTTFVKIDSGVQKYSFSSSTETWEYYGYASLDSLYNAAVNQYVENYNHQDNVA
ncbi:zinc ribbon domain-containing protein [uncultured Gemmiger sp.]|uniref:zinc ribbon domain-containing protein n=1 Tax=uncultured Gemmiger sp. TaxID=1623490 RepID=UPI00265F099D|nr:zinc ribbon domain-containing protein [uncultured Gemmiger sp.]